MCNGENEAYEKSNAKAYQTTDVNTSEKADAKACKTTEVKTCENEACKNSDAEAYEKADAKAYEADGVKTCEKSNNEACETADTKTCKAEEKVGGGSCEKSKGKVNGRRAGKPDVRRMTAIASLVSVAMVLAYVESLIPAFFTVPGVKVGLANAVTLFALYALDTRSAACISFMRVSLAALLFGSTVSFIYSASGAVLSLLVMILLRRLDVFSPIGVSVAGGVAHNIGQVIAAALTMESVGILYYLAPLLISGTLAGGFIGILTGILIDKSRGVISKILRRK
ncbi:MAG: Gx transporter family protein [Clostridia bacterium]|nr:Gx transporter family protein [Clostridia bacterium]